MFSISHKELINRIDKRISYLGTNRTAVSREATGKADVIRDMARKGTMPSSKALLGLSKALKCNYEYLTGDSSDPEANNSSQAFPEDAFIALVTLILERAEGKSNATKAALLAKAYFAVQGKDGLDRRFVETYFEDRPLDQ